MNNLDFKKLVSFIRRTLCPSSGGHCVLHQDTVPFEAKQLFHTSRFSVSITALSGRLNSESLLRLWKGEK